MKLDYFVFLKKRRLTVVQKTFGTVGTEKAKDLAEIIPCKIAKLAWLFSFVQLSGKSSVGRKLFVEDSTIITHVLRSF